MPSHPRVVTRCTKAVAPAAVVASLALLIGPLLASAQVVVSEEYALDLSAANGSPPGFRWGVHQLGPPERPNSNLRTEDQLAGRLGANLASPFEAGPADCCGLPENPGNLPIYFNVPGTINFEQGGNPAGTFAGDGSIPGIPVGDPSNIAAEALTWLALSPGDYEFAVRSDDGFRLTLGGAVPEDRLATEIGRFDGGRGADVPPLMPFRITKTGLYAARLIWEEGGGDASIELYQRTTLGEEILVNDTFAGGIAAYRSVVADTAGYAESARPMPGQTAVWPTAEIEVVLVDVSSPQLSLDGAAVSAQVTTNGNRTTVRYQPSVRFAPLSTHTVFIEYGTLLGVKQRSWSFTVINYGTLTPDMRVAPDPGQPGFLWTVFQNEARQDASSQRAEEALAGTLTGGGVLLNNLVNATNVGAASGPGVQVAPTAQAAYRFAIPGVINLSQTGGEANGNFAADQQMPGIPGGTGSTDGIAAEVLTYVDLPAGMVTFGVNSDDGFRTTGGPAQNPTQVFLGGFEGGRGAADTVFPVVVEAAGTYPLRTLWYEGGVGANIEIFTVEAGGAKFLLNDIGNGGRPTYRPPGSGSSNVQFSLPIVAGWNLISTPITVGGNTLNDVWPVAPNGSRFWKLDNAAQVWLPMERYTNGLGWQPGNVVLKPGEGGWFNSPQVATLQSTGLVVATPPPPALPDSACWVIGSPRLQPASYGDLAGSGPFEGTRMYRYNPGSGFSPYNYSFGAWEPGPWQVPAGVAVFLCGPNGSVPNFPPTLTAVTTLSGAVEGTSFTIDYATLQSAADETDPDSATISFRVEGVASGTETLTKNGSPVTAGSTLLGPGESWVWTPVQDANGTLGAFSISAWDGISASSPAVSVSVTVTAINDAPVLVTIGTRTVNEENPLSITVSGSDSNDTPANALTFSASNLPAGATFNPSTRTFNWTPSELQQGSYQVTFNVSDDGTPSLADSEVVTITVNEVNDAPLLNPIGARTVNEESPLSITVSGSDSNDTPANALTFSASNLPAGATFNPSTRTLNWTPGEAQQGSYQVTFNVSDNGTPSLADSEVVTITVNEVNDPPILNPIGARTVNEENPLSITVSGSDSNDTPANALTFSASNLPAGATFNPSNRTFNWTPGELQQGSYQVTFNVSDNGTPNLVASEVVTIRVNEVNDAPLLNPIGARTVNEESPLSITVSGSDSNDTPANALTFSASNLPVGATFNPSTRTLNWTPGEAQQGSYQVTFNVSDNGTPNLVASEVVTIRVNEVNDAPLLNPIGARTVTEENPLSIRVSGSDSNDTPANALTFSASNLPVGATFNSSTRTFNWTPTVSQPGIYQVTFTVTDDGTPRLQGFENVTITVSKLSEPPTLDPIPDQVMRSGTSLVVPLIVLDPDTAVTNMTRNWTTSDPTVVASVVFGTIPTAPLVATVRPQPGRGGLVTVTIELGDGDSTVSQSFWLLVRIGTGAPEIMKQPEGIVASPGETRLLSVLADGADPISYIWHRNGVALPQQTGRQLVFTNLQPQDSGTYSVGVYNPFGLVESAPVEVRVEDPSARVLVDTWPPSVPVSVGSGILQGWNTNATPQAGEPDHAGIPGGRSLWFTWMAPATGIATLNALGSTFDTVLAVYQGNPTNETRRLVASNEDGEELGEHYYNSELRFNVQANQSYQVAIDGFYRSTGWVTLTFALRVTPETVPIVLEQPASLAVAPGTSVVPFAVVAADPADPAGTRLSYRWFRNGIPLSGSSRTNAVGPADGGIVGAYHVEVANRFQTNRSATWYVELSSYAPPRSTLVREDVWAFASLAWKLWHPATPLETYLNTRLSDEARRELAQWPVSPEVPSSLQDLLVTSLASVIEGESIYRADRFADVSLRQETERFLREARTSADVSRLNRLLLEDAFSNEIAFTRDAGVSTQDKLENAVGPPAVRGPLRLAGRALAEVGGSAGVPVPVFPGIPGAQLFSNEGSGRQVSESRNCGIRMDRTRWLALQVDQPGTLVADTLGSEIDTVAILYRHEGDETNVWNYPMVVCNTDVADSVTWSLLTTEITNTGTYYAQIDGPPDQTGLMQFNWLLLTNVNTPTGPQLAPHLGVQHFLTNRLVTADGFNSLDYTTNYVIRLTHHTNDNWGLEAFEQWPMSTDPSATSIVAPLTGWIRLIPPPSPDAPPVRFFRGVRPRRSGVRRRNEDSGSTSGAAGAARRG